MWDLIVLIPDHCLSIYFAQLRNLQSIYFLARLFSKVNQYQ